MIGHNFQGYEVTGNEKLINVVRHVLEDIVWSSKESLEKFIRELREVATHVNTWGGYGSSRLGCYYEYRE